MSLIAQFVGNAEVFPILQARAYFNHAGIAPWPRQTVEAVAAFAKAGFDPAGIGAFWGRIDSSRELMRKLINADEGEVAVVRNTADAITCVSTAIDWNPGDRIVLARSEYPANVYAWQAAAARFGCEVVFVDERVDSAGVARVREDDLIAAADHPKTRLLALSHVQWTSGQRMDAGKIGRFCASRGILFALDAIQSAGVVSVDVKRDHVDFLMSGGHKWLMGPVGAGILFIRKTVLKQLWPLVVGADSVKQGWNGPLGFDLRDNARVFEIGTPALASIVGIESSLKMLLEIGIDSIEKHVLSLGETFARRIAAAGLTVVTPMESRGGAVCFTSSKVDAVTIAKRMMGEKNIELAARGGRARFSPHFYNTPEQAEKCAQAVIEIAG